MSDLTDDEAALLYHVACWGSDGYPIERSGRGWVVRAWRSVKGSPIVYRTKSAAVDHFEAWLDLALERWRDMKARNPNMILTAEGVRS